jgi:phosphomannomutase/phosphoglucomutase
VSTPELNIDVRDDNKFDIVEKLQALDYPDGDASRIDGIRVDYPDGWGLVRASNTTPVLVLRFEAANETALNRIRDQFQERLLAVDSSLIIPNE